jgi:hypothetical protein
MRLTQRGGTGLMARHFHKKLRSIRYENSSPRRRRLHRRSGRLQFQPGQFLRQFGRQQRQQQRVGGSRQRRRRTGCPDRRSKLAQEIQMVVGMLKGQLPLKQQTPEGELRVTNLEANGGEIIYTMELPNDLNEASFAQFKEQLPIRTCASPQARTLLERGGTYTYRLKDNGGEEFTASVSSCS